MTDCEICDNIFDNIRLIDTKVKDLRKEKDILLRTIVWCRIGGVHESGIKDLEKSLEETIIQYLLAKTEQIDIHKSLTKHYREDHLNGE